MKKLFIILFSVITVFCIASFASISNSVFAESPSGGWSSWNPEATGNPGEISKTFYQYRDVASWGGLVKSDQYPEFYNPTTYSYTYQCNPYREYHCHVYEFDGGSWTPDCGSSGCYCGPELRYDTCYGTANGYYQVGSWGAWSELQQDRIESTKSREVKEVTMYSYPISYSITYDLDGGTIDTPNPESYTIIDPEIVLNAPKKTGFDFIGWEPEGIIPTGSMGDKHFTAQWKKSVYSVKFFDFNNTLLKSVNVYYGESVTAPEEYDVEGYDFDGWEPADFSFITESMTIQGMYHIRTYPVLITTNHGRETLLQKVLEHFNSVTYLDMNGNEISSVTISEPYTINIEPDEIYGYTFKSYKVTDDGDGNYFVQSLYTPKKYKVSFFDTNDRLLDVQYVEYLCDAEPPTAPKIHGYTFAGWDKPYQNITEDSELKALYNDDESVPRWSVTFVVESGDTSYGYFNINNEMKYSYTIPKVIDTTKLDSLLPTYATSTNCKFVGWYINGEKVNPSTYKVVEITTVTAKFISDVNHNNIDDDTETVTVEFDSMGGTEIDPIQVTLNHKLKELDSPTKEGFEFGGWYLSSACVTQFDFKSNITKDMILYAKWIDLGLETKPETIPAPKVVSSVVVEEPKVQVLIPDYQGLYCQIDFVNANDGSLLHANEKYGTRFYIYNLKNQKIREYQARQNSVVNLPKITLAEGEHVEWVLRWVQDDEAYHLIPSLY